MKLKPSFVAVAMLSLVGCATQPQENKAAPAQYVGTTHPFAAEAIYFLITDRFVDGDPSNNHEHQGGEHPTFNLPLIGEDGKTANVGYMGGDFRGVLNNAAFIRDMGFTAIWMTPIVDNPDEAFAGGEPISFGGAFKDGGKTGYHGYWGVNFFKVDEHYPSVGLEYADLTRSLREQFGLKTVLDVVTNHGSPSFSMPTDQPKFGEIYGKDGRLLADHQNLTPAQLSADNPLHQFFHREEDILQLSNLNDENPAVLDYFVDAYRHWLTQGAAALRIDTIKHVPHHFWKQFSDRLRAQHPDLFMFGESYDYNANFIAQHTLAKNGGISVLDFPGQQAISKVFSASDSDFAELLAYLHLTHGPYANPYELTTFYDNHDMARMDASDNGFIDAHNWLFTSRGIPVVYMGSEMGYMRGTVEHQGNRNYYGQGNIDLAKQHPIHAQLQRIANVRKAVPALQRGLQLNLTFAGNQAAFYRVLQSDDEAQTALVLLNKGDSAAHMKVQRYMQPGVWREQLSGEVMQIGETDSLEDNIPAHGVRVWVREGVIEQQELRNALSELILHR
ncbi:alpha-amylase family glycosyl hydrolase [Bowmanella pacifica]|uniref:Cyclomaltodextrin glucanotransferase n=1 Tax=Bowmanella pacifica TaxID=502051 RepID=A0A917YR28_9ALTE|nr:cyclomaltodextrin glucanotransferase [Bowmanella pacifica]